MALAVDAYARGGGGGNFGGGGGGGGSGGGGFGGGGGGGDGGGELLFWLIWLCFRHPAIGIPLLIVLLVLGALGGRKGRHAHQGRTIRRARARRPLIASMRVEESVRAGDPDFDPVRFRARVETAFRKVQSAWCGHDLTGMRPFVSDGIHERFTLQIREQRDLGYRDHMDGLEIAAVELAEVETEGHLEVLTVRVTATAKDYRVALDTGKRIGSPVMAETFTEFWTFLRRRGARTKNEQGLIEGYCPNCGAAVALNQWSKCEHCSAFLRSGEHDWVLVEITQESEWREREPVDTSGIRALRARDPAFSLQHLEDLASVMFWRAAMAERVGSIDPLRKMATPDLCDERRGHIAASIDPDGTRRWFGERGVGSVEVRAALPGDAGGRDRAAVEVRWSGTLFSSAADGTLKRERKSGVVTSLLLLERAAGTATAAGTVVSSAHCGSCGAPDAGGETDACEYCGDVLNDGTRDWVLAALLKLHSREGRDALAALRDAGPGAADDTPAASVTSPPGTHGLVAWMANACLADGHLDPREEKRLVAVATRSGISHDEVGRMLAAARRGDLAAPSPVGLPEARAWMDEAAAVALADGSVTYGEQQVLLTLGERAGLSAADVRMQISKTRARLHEEAKSTLRADRDHRRRER